MKKEQQKQETLEEAAERLYQNGCDGTDRSAEIYRRIFIEGAKWQQQQNKNLYSEEEVLHILTKFSKFGDVINEKKYLNQWFEQFKKK